MELTDEAVKAATCPPGRKDALFFDSKMRGFGVRVSANGTKTFIAQYSAGGTKRRVVIGQWGLITLKQARDGDARNGIDGAKGILGRAANGSDPFGERKARADAQRAAKAAEKARDAEAAYTVGRLFADWQAAREGERRASYLADAGSALRRHFASWLDRAASSVTVTEAVRALDAIKAQGSPIMANRVLAYARAAYGWAVKRQALAVNPFAGIEAPAREHSRDRVLDVNELGEIWRAADALTPPYGPFARVLMLTLQRREEVAAMRWSELSADLTTWTLPAERAKNGKGHLVHLAEPVREIIAALPRRDGCAFVFPAEGYRTARAPKIDKPRHLADLRPISAFSAAKEKLDAAVLKARREQDPEAVALPAWVLHDFRRSGVTTLANMGFAPHVADKLLNHVSGAIKGVAAVYQRAEFLSERRTALEAWAQCVVAAADQREPAQNVVAMRR